MARTPMKDMSVYYEDLEGTSIRDRYMLERFIKAGGSSGVYLSYDNVMNRQVAVKLLPPSDKVMGSRFEREARGLSVLSHPNTVSVYDFGKTPEGYHYMVLEYLEGGTLKEVMTGERWLAPKRAVHIFSQICRALRDAHGKGIVHRDIKPSNIFLIDCDGDPDFVKVLDFGVAKMLGDQHESKRADITQIGRIIGTPRYMPPEQITSQDVDVRADVYTVGVVLYEMLCGSVPFLDTSLGGLLMLHLKEPPPPFSSHRSPYLNETPPGLETAVRKALEKQPLDRFDTIEEFREVVENAMAGILPEVTSITPTPGYVPPPFPGVDSMEDLGIQPGDLVVEAVLEDDELEPISLEPIEEAPDPPPLLPKEVEESKPVWKTPMFTGGAIALVVGLFIFGGGDEAVPPESQTTEPVKVAPVQPDPVEVPPQVDAPAPVVQPADEVVDDGPNAEAETEVIADPSEMIDAGSSSPVLEGDTPQENTEPVPPVAESEPEGLPTVEKSPAPKVVVEPKEEKPAAAAVKKVKDTPEPSSGEAVVKEEPRPEALPEKEGDGDLDTWLSEKKSEKKKKEESIAEKKRKERKERRERKKAEAAAKKAEEKAKAKAKEKERPKVKTRVMLVDELEPDPPKPTPPPAPKPPANQPAVELLD